MDVERYRTRMNKIKKTEKFGEKYKLLREIQVEIKNESIKTLHKLAEGFKQMACTMQTLKDETEKEYES